MMKKILLFFVIIAISTASIVGIANAFSGMGFQKSNWSGSGMNYGHFTGGGSSFNQTVVDADMAYLYSKGVRYIRVAMTSANYATNVADTKSVALRAKAAGMYVIWGLTVQNPITPTNWTAYKAAWDANASWANANGIDEFSLGNEEELHNDDISPTDTTIRSDIRAGATTLKASYPSLNLSYQSSGGSSHESTWVSEGKGGLDRIGFNEYDTINNFTSRLATLYAGFGSNVDITEWSSLTLGIADWSGDSRRFAREISDRFKIIKDSGIGRAYYFTYKDGAFGVTQNSWAVYQSTGLLKLAGNVLGLN